MAATSLASALLNDWLVRFVLQAPAAEIAAILKLGLATATSCMHDEHVGQKVMAERLHAYSST